MGVGLWTTSAEEEQKSRPAHVRRAGAPSSTGREMTSGTLTDYLNIAGPLAFVCFPTNHPHILDGASGVSQKVYSLAVSTFEQI